MIPYKRLFAAVFILFNALNCVAQEVIEKKNKLNGEVTETYYVSKADPQTKNGSYQAFFRRKRLIAEGAYINNKKTGTWNFYSTRGALLQKYNFTKDSLEFEASIRPPSNFHYLIDKVITDSDRITIPVRIGGRYYGFLPYLNVFKTPFSINIGDEQSFVAEIELLVSPMGRLASYKVHLVATAIDYDQTFTMSLNFFKEEEKQFIPATFNHQPILSRIIIKCSVNEDGGLDYYY